MVLVSVLQSFVTIVGIFWQQPVLRIAETELLNLREWSGAARSMNHSWLCDPLRLLAGVKQGGACEHKSGQPDYIAVALLLKAPLFFMISSPLSALAYRLSTQLHTQLLQLLLFQHNRVTTELCGCSCFSPTFVYKYGWLEIPFCCC